MEIKYVPEIQALWNRANSPLPDDLCINPHEAGWYYYEGMWVGPYLTRKIAMEMAS